MVSHELKALSMKVIRLRVFTNSSPKRTNPVSQTNEKLFLISLAKYLLNDEFSVSSAAPYFPVICNFQCHAISYDIFVKNNPKMMVHIIMVHATAIVSLNFWSEVSLIFWSLHGMAVSASRKFEARYVVYMISVHRTSSLQTHGGSKHACTLSLLQIPFYISPYFRDSQEAKIKILKPKLTTLHTLSGTRQIQKNQQMKHNYVFMTNNYEQHSLHWTTNKHLTTRTAFNALQVAQIEESMTRNA